MGKNINPISIKNGEELAKKLRDYSIKADTAVQKAILKGCIVIEGQAKIDSPVDTGYMRASITHQLINNGGKTEGLVGTNVEYAPYLEYGTKRHKAQPFLRPAYSMHINQIKDDIKKALKK